MVFGGWRGESGGGWAGRKDWRSISKVRLYFKRIRKRLGFLMVFRRVGGWIWGGWAGRRVWRSISEARLYFKRIQRRLGFIMVFGGWGGGSGGGWAGTMEIWTSGFFRGHRPQWAQGTQIVHTYQITIEICMSRAMDPESRTLEPTG